MFGSFVEECIGSPDHTLDERLRANELAQRRLEAERAALVAVAEHRAIYSPEHRSMAGYLRSTLNTANGTVVESRKLARLLTDFPDIGEALWAGRISVDHAVQLARLPANRRVAHLAPTVMPVLIELAEHSSHREFAEQVTRLISQLDQDGAFDDLSDSVEGRRASVVDVGGEVVISAVGGDPVQAAQLQAVFDSFCEAEYRADLEARRAMYGDEADQHELPRQPAQRRFDALLAIFAAAAASPEGRALPEPEVHLVTDVATAHEAFVAAGILLPNGQQIELDGDGDFADGDALLDGLAAELADDPEAFLRRRCETSNGSPVHPSVVLRALLTGHVRRVVMDSRGVVIDYGSRQRLFTGLARAAAMFLAQRCEHAGCEMPAKWSQVDHNIEHHAGGPTDQRNRNIECGHHNRFKHRERWRTRRDARGRAYTIRADGTIVLPVGERAPDLTIDEMNELARARLADLTARRA